MDREKLLQNPLPVDRVAARVVFGKAEHWTPGVSQNEPYWTEPPALRPITREMRAAPHFVDLTGRRMGALTIIGLHCGAKERALKITRWVARCQCGNFVIRSAKAVKKNLDPVACCPRCVAKRTIQGVRQEDAAIRYLRETTQPAGA